MGILDGGAVVCERCGKGQSLRRDDNVLFDESERGGFRVEKRRISLRALLIAVRIRKMSSWRPGTQGLDPSRFTEDLTPKVEGVSKP